jgi:Tropinone reductase 1
MCNWNLKNKKAVVTGGTKGIGKAIVQEFLELGAEVLFTARNSEESKLLQKEWQEKGWEASALPGDVNDRKHQMELRTWIKDHWNGTLDILVNNAGVNLRKPTAEYTADEYQHVLDTNLTAPFELTRTLFPFLQKRKGAGIINIASVAGSFDAGTGAPYGMSKAALIQLTKNLAKEWAHLGIRVNCVSPWFTQTPLTKDLLANQEKTAAIISRTPMRRVARPEEVAAAVAFMAMDKAAYITGQNISVDGGATINIL